MEPTCVSSPTRWQNLSVRSLILPHWPELTIAIRFSNVVGKRLSRSSNPEIKNTYTHNPMTKPAQTQLVFNREKLVRVFFFSCFALIVYQMFYLAKPFFTALLLASMLALAGSPLNHHLRKKLKSPTLVALILT